MNNKNLKSVIKTNPITHEIDPPVILLKRERGKSVIGKINYFNLEMKLSGITMDEVSFKVYKFIDGKKQFIWDKLVSDKIIEIIGYGQFEISVSKENDSGDNIYKIVKGVSLECELSGTKLYEVHCNDDYYFEYMADTNMDSYGNIIPIKLWNPRDPKHSLLHIILEKVPAWHFARVPTYITVVQNGNFTKELTSGFQRTFNFNNITIYDALTGEIATESNLVFAFDTANREIYAYDRFEEIGEDTNVFINTRNLANNISIQDNKDSLINTFRVSGGDDIINNYIAAINVTGTNYISMYSPFMYEDMPEGLVNAIKSYQKFKADINRDYYGGYDVFTSLNGSIQNTNTILTYDGVVSHFHSLPSASTKLGHYYYVSDEKKYYVSNGSSWAICGVFVRLCSAYEYLGYLEHSMMPNVSLKNTTALIQMQNLLNDLRNTSVAVSKLSIFNPSSFEGITNNIIAYCKVILDNRYTVELVEDAVNNYPRYYGGRWTGKIRVYRTIDKTDSSESILSVSINDDNINFAKQKILKALAKDSMTDIEKDILAYKTSVDYGKLLAYFRLYCSERLKSFYDAYENCLSILMSLKSSQKSNIITELYNMYRLRRDAVFEVYRERQNQIDAQKVLINSLESEKEKIQSQADFKTYLDKIDTSYWNMLNSYRRECEYSNSNYVSDGLESDGQILAKCKELLDTAEYELSMACQLQRTLNIDLADLLIMEEFKPFWDKFCLYNYIRIETDQEILKLRLVEVNINFDSIEKLTVTFADNISGNGNILDNDMDLFRQAASIAPSFNYTQKQASQGQKGYNQVADWMDTGLKAANTTISNSDNNEITFNNYGINLKDMTDEGNYGDWQIRLIGQGIYFTNDNWKTCYGALGSIYIDGVRTTGLIAKNLIGELIAGQTLYITNEKGSFLLNGDTAKFTDITIDYQDKNGNRVKIGGASDRIFSISHNGNEVLYFNNVSNKMVMTGTLQGCDGDFSGTLTACNISGSNIVGNTITGGSISGTTVSASNLSGNTITGGSIKIGSKFYVNENGILNATDGIFSGKVTATSGSFTGDIYANNGYFKGDITGCRGTFSGLVSGGSININDRFKVDSHGNLTIGNPYSSDIFKVSYDGHVTLPSNATLSWGQITETENVIQQNDQSSNNYITKLTKDTIQTCDVVANNLHVKSANIDGLVTASQIKTEGLIADDIRANKIDGKKITVEEIYIPYAQGTSPYTEKYNVYYINGTADNGGVPSAGWVKRFCHTDNLYVNHFGLGYGEVISFGKNKGNDITTPLQATTPEYVKECAEHKSSTASDIRLKTNIHSLPDISNTYMKLKPVSYCYKNGIYNCKPNNIEFGLRANDVAELFPCDKYNIAWKAYKLSDEEKLYCPDYAYRVDYKSIGIMTVQMVQNHEHKLQNIIQEEMDMKNKILSLQGENAILKQRLKRLEEKVYA